MQKWKEKEEEQDLVVENNECKVESRIGKRRVAEDLKMIIGKGNGPTEKGNRTMGKRNGHTGKGNMTMGKGNGSTGKGNSTMGKRNGPT